MAGYGLCGRAPEASLVQWVHRSDLAPPDALPTVYALLVVQGGTYMPYLAASWLCGCVSESYLILPCVGAVT